MKKRMLAVGVVLGLFFGSADVLATAQVVPLQQKPELYNGCEVTSLAMLLQQAGHPVDKMQLAREVRKDPAPERRDAGGRTLSWGNPHVGFVGDVTGRSRGYGVYHGPIAQLLGQHLPGRAVDITGTSFEGLLESVAKERPAVVWTTVTFRPPEYWVMWQSPSGLVRATFQEHAVLLVGSDASTVTVADPLDGRVKQVDQYGFRRSWEAMGSQAVTYR